jgi:glycosyltransferase involved in cell wall biosynthesis
MVKIAFMGIPSLSGNYTHFKYLRDNLPDYRFYLVALGRFTDNNSIQDNDFINLGRHLDRKMHQKELARLFLDFCEEQQIDIIIPMNSGIVASCIPFLKREKVIHIVNTDTQRVYHYITSSLEYSSKIVCISQRQRDVLSKRMAPQVFESKTVLIPHGVHHQTLLEVQAHQAPLIIGFLGRIHHGHKGVLKIPDILKQLRISYRFELVGDGQDKLKLAKGLEGGKIPFTLHGYVSQDKIPEFISRWDLLLFPSQVEGFPLTLIEAMNNGVVPIANELPGITDFIITSGKDGFIVKENNIKDFVSRIEQLNGDRDLLCRMKHAARETVRDRFELSVIIQQYTKMFDEALETEKPGGTKNFSEWKAYVEYQPRLTSRLINRAKKLLSFFL